MKTVLPIVLAGPVGIPIVYLGTIIMCGGVDKANTLIFISIVCSLGAALVVWLPVCFLAGWIPLFVISQFVFPRKGEPIVAEPSDRPQLSRDEIAVIKYLRAAQGSGIAAARADAALRRNGWDEAIIQRARHFVGRL